MKILTFALPLAIVLFGGYGMSKQLSKTSKDNSAPLERLPAPVADERTKISDGGQNRSAKTRYFATLQFADGSRRELDAFSNVAGKITRIAASRDESRILWSRLPGFHLAFPVRQVKPAATIIAASPSSGLT